MAGLWHSPIYKFISARGEKIIIDVTTSISHVHTPKNIIGEEIIPFFKERNVRTVLDLGAGALRNVFPFLRAGFDVYAVEFEEAFHRPFCMKELEKTYRSPNFVKLIFPRDFLSDRRKFDAVLLCNVLQYMPVEKERRILLKYIKQKLKRPGYLFYTSRYGNSRHLEDKYRINDGYYRRGGSWHFYREFTTQETHALMEKSGFEKVTSLSRPGDQTFLYRIPVGTWPGATPQAPKHRAKPSKPKIQKALRAGPSSEEVEFAAFAPGGVTPNEAFVLDVWAYLHDQYSTILKMAREVRRGINLGRKAGVSVERGTILSIRIEIETLEVEQPLDTVVWSGVPTNASFIVKVPSETKVGKYPAKVSIGYQGITIAKLAFVIPVTHQDHPETDRYVQTKCPRTAFASYASENRDEVLTRIQGMKKIAPGLDIFLDVLSLRSGQNWREKLEEHVPTKDTFYLFWSQSAASSKWVKREWKLALNRRGLDYIDPVPLEEPDLVPPPKKLAALHFSDAYLAHIAHERLKKQMGKIT